MTNTNEVWRVAAVEARDATGNRSRATRLSPDGGAAGFAFAPGLWTDEAAWRFTMQLKREAGLRPDELLIFRNVPLGNPGQRHPLGMTATRNGVTVTLRELDRRAPLTNGSWSMNDLTVLTLTNSALPAGFHLDLLHMLCDPGGTNRPVSSSVQSVHPGGQERRYGFPRVPAEARTADFVFAVQRGRKVEFTAQPEPAR